MQKLRYKTRVTNQGQTGTGCQSRTSKAFTLLEVVVAIGILAMVISFSGMIFKISIEAYRTSGANSEIMQKLRAITDQLNTDFKGIRTDAPLMIWFQQDPNDPKQRYDQIMFFADGDFQSTQLYDYPDGFSSYKVPYITGERIRGNAARIYYGQAVDIDPNSGFVRLPWQVSGPGRRFARRRHILTADSDILTWSVTNDLSPEVYFNNERFEHDSLSLSGWKTVDKNTYDILILPACFADANYSFNRPLIDIAEPNTFHKLMCDGVGSFTVQFSHPGPFGLGWFPSNDPDGDGLIDDSHFLFKSSDWFGVRFNIPSDSNAPPWYPIGKVYGNTFSVGDYPLALKFTFRLYDERGIVEETINGVKRKGRTFTHIVYLDDSGN